MTHRGLSEQESRCVDQACALLDQRLGGRWQINSGPTPDEQFPNVRSPEVIVGNGKCEAAIEVKRLLGSSRALKYHEAWQSLRGWNPPDGGFYYVSPPHDAPFPFERQTMMAVKKAVGATAPSTATDEWVALPGLPESDLGEWKIMKTESAYGPGIAVISVVVGDWPSAIRQCFTRALNSGIEKFHRAWAEHHVLVLQCSSLAPFDEVVSVLREIGPGSLDGIDFVIAVDDRDSEIVYEIRNRRIMQEVH